MRNPGCLPLGSSAGALRAAIGSRGMVASAGTYPRACFQHQFVIMYRFWHGPIIGLTLSHLWSSFASCLFLEFGRLTPGDTYADRKGNIRQRQPDGEWSIASMEAWPAWWLRQNGKLIGSWVDCRPVRLRALRRLIGRRLNAFQIDQSTKSTRLSFSLGLELETRTDISRLRNKPHWLLRGPAQGETDWPPIVLTGKK